MSIRVTLLGTGVGIPVPGRSQSGLLFEAEESLLVDCGAGTLLRLTEAGVDIREIDTVLLTHLHLDHSSEVIALANARYLMDAGSLEVFGPEGTARWLQMVHSAYPYLREMKIAVHEIKAGERHMLKGFEIYSGQAVHSVTALAHRLEAGGRAVTYSGDTEPSVEVMRLAMGSDLLVHECSFPDDFEVTNHTTPTRLGEIVRDVGRIVLTHFYPQAAGQEEEMARVVSRVSGIPAEAGRDLQVVEV